jgi:hypothetical protein
MFDQDFTFKHALEAAPTAYSKIADAESHSTSFSAKGTGTFASKVIFSQFLT